MKKSSLQIEPARDGGYVVKEVGTTTPMWKTLFAGSLEKCVEYVRDYYFEPAPAHKVVGKYEDFGDSAWVGRYLEAADPCSTAKA